MPISAPCHDSIPNSSSKLSQSSPQTHSSTGITCRYLCVCKEQPEHLIATHRPRLLSCQANVPRSRCARGEISKCLWRTHRSI